MLLVALLTPLTAAAAALTYSTYYGGSGADSGRAIAVDGAGNIYVAVGGSGLEGGIVKLSPDGQSVLYTAPLGDMSPSALAVDAAGNAYVAATCPYPRSGVTFNCPTLGAIASGRPQSQGDEGGYIIKLAPSGSMLFSTSVGGTGSVAMTGIAVDAAGNVYVTGYNAYGGFPTTRAAFAKAGVTEGLPAFVAAIAADASRFLYFVEFRLGTDIFQPTAIAVDRTGAAYVLGGVGGGGSQFPTTPGAFQSAAGSGSSTAALAKIAPGGSALAYATYFGSGTVLPSGVAVDADGNAYIAGGAGPGLPTFNALQPTFAGGATDAFVARLNPAGSALVFSTYLGGSGDDEAAGLALDSSANVYVAGIARSTNFPQVNALPAAQGAPVSSFVAQLPSDGRSLVYSTYYGDSQTFIGDVRASATGTAYVTGTTFSPSYPTVRPVQPTYGGSGDAFVGTLEPSSVRVFITSPAEGATVTGSVWSDVWAENYVGTSNTFTLSIGDTVLATVTASNHATLAWDSSRVADGPQTLTATVRDSAGHVGTSTRAVTIRNGTTPTLTAAFTAPAANATVSGSVNVGMTATGASGTITFTLGIDGAQVFTAAGTATTATFAWTATPGPHVLSLTVRDGAGRTATATRNVTGAGGGGTTPPPGGTLKVFITSPAAGATVTGTVWSDIWVEGAAAGARTFTLASGGVTLVSASDASNHVTVPWDSARLSNGTQTIVATVRDAAGNTGSSTRAFNVQNAGGGGGGTAPLAASFAAPGEGAAVSGTVSVSMSASGGTAPYTYTLAIDGAQVASSGASAYSWNTAPYSPGSSHTLALTVTDARGASATASRTVTVQSGGGDGTPPPGPIRVIITQPRSGETVRGVVWFTIWVEGAAAGSNTYTLSEGGRTLGTTTTTSSGPVSIPWTTTPADNGPRAPTIGVRDATGATGATSLNLTVSN